jgi:hypothetical protein
MGQQEPRIAFVVHCRFSHTGSFTICPSAALGGSWPRSTNEEEKPCLFKIRTARRLVATFQTEQEAALTVNHLDALGIRAEIWRDEVAYYGR